MQRIAERGGALEISLPRRRRDASGHSGHAPGADVIWRVRLLEFNDEEILVERPSAMGAAIPLQDGVELVGVMTLGQNRWMFHTRLLGDAGRIGGPRGGEAIRLQTPEGVERCTRRAFYRISTAGLVLPEVELRPLLSESSATPAEIALRERMEEMLRSEVAGFVGDEEPLVMPEVGPASKAKLLNVGGGGVGVMLTGEDAKGLESHRRQWMLIHLSPQLPAALGVVAKLAHTRIDSEQRVYAGFAFEFDHNPAHRKFVVDTLCRYSMLIQREQFESRALSE